MKTPVNRSLNVRDSDFNLTLDGPYHLFLSICMLLLTFDMFTSYNKIGSFLSYLVLIFLVFQLRDINKLSLVFLVTISSLICAVTFTSLFNAFDFEIYVKYCLLCFIFAVSGLPSRDLSSKIYSIIYIPLICILIVGYVQIAILLINPAPYISYSMGHFRPIGLSTEPTFYSQQVLFLWLFSRKYVLLDSSKRTFIDVISIVMILFCASRSSMLILAIFVLTSFNSRKSIILFALLVMFILLDFDLSEFTVFYDTFLRNMMRLLSVSGEPREVAFNEMLEILSVIPITGYGFNSLTSSAGLEIGSLYAVFPLALVYSLSLLSIPIFLIMLLQSTRACVYNNVVLIFGILVCMMVMPFLFTAFGLFVWTLTTGRQHMPSR